jgi:hypothetical protein
MRNYIRYFKLFFIYSFINHIEKLILDLYRILIYESFAFPLKFLHIPALEIATLIRITNRFSSNSFRYSYHYFGFAMRGFFDRSIALIEIQIINYI